MSQVSVSEAARLVGRDRKTLYRAIKQGRLSATINATGERQIETSELARVYVELRDTRHSAATGALPHHETPDAATRLASLEAENAQLRARLGDKDAHILDLQSSLRMLEHKSAVSVVKKAWWKW